MKKSTAFTEEEIAEMMKEAQETKLVAQEVKVVEAQAKLNPTVKKPSGLTSDSWAYGVARGKDGKYQVVELSFNSEKGTAKLERIISRDSNKMVAGMKAENATRQVVITSARKK